MSLAVGHRIERYEIVSILGVGGMAEVYKVRHVTLETLHALKVLKISSQVVRERLVQEGKVQATLRQRNIVAVTDVLDVDGAPGLLMEFIEGPAMDLWLRSNKPDVEQAIHIFRGVVAAVERAHDHGVVHRDLKPGNVLLVDERGTLVPKVADFGLAKVLADDSGGPSRTRSMSTMGTPGYMAPEQIRDSKNVDERADIFALGCMLYDLICHRPAFDGADLLEILNAVSQGRYTPPEELTPGLPDAVLQTIRATLQVDPDSRPASCAAVLQILDGLHDPRLSVSPFSRSSGGNETLELDSLGDGGAGGLAYAARPATAPKPPPGLQSVPPVANTTSETLFPDHEAVDEPLVESRSKAPIVLALLGVLVLGVGVAWALTRPDPVAEPIGVEVAAEPEAEAPVEVVEAIADAEEESPAAAPPTAELREAEAEAPTTPVRAPARPATPSKASSTAPVKAPPAEEPPAEEPVPEPPKGATLSWSGADAVALEGKAGRFSSGAVPPGTYSIRATFGGQTHTAGKVTVRDGQKTVTVQCNSGFETCTGS